MSKPTFLSLWFQLEPLVPSVNRVAARAILALAWQFSKDDEPPPKTGHQPAHQAADQGAYLPTDEEIRQACQEIQSTWSDAERRHRLGIRSAELEEHYTIPTMQAPRQKPSHRSDAS